MPSPTGRLLVFTVVAVAEQTVMTMIGTLSMTRGTDDKYELL